MDFRGIIMHKNFESTNNTVDGESTLVSNESSMDENFSIEVKCSNASPTGTAKIGFRFKDENGRPNRMYVIIISVLCSIIVLGIGYWAGWMIGNGNGNNMDNSLMNTPIENPTIEPTSTSRTSSSTTTPASSLSSSTIDTPTLSPNIKESTPKSPPVIGSPTDINALVEDSIASMASVASSTASSTASPSSAGLSKTTTADPIEPAIIEAKPTYIPGNLTRMQNNLLLSEGLQARVIAESGKSVQYDDGSASDINFHILPDGGATFPDDRWWNPGGWIYVSNSEAINVSEGGVGAITFDRYGLIIHYRMVLENTYLNCGGGRTPWNTWVSCEEIEFTGQIYQVDPTGQRAPELMTLGSAGGRWESFSYDVRDKDKPHFFSTEDHNKGTTRRFTPNVTHWGGDEWKMLHEEGVVDFLFVNPNEERTGGSFEWIDDLAAAKNNARSFYPQSEGIDIQDGIMYIVCKKIQQLFIFDLDKMTYHNVSTVTGLFDGDPDQIQSILGQEGGLLYFTEEGGVNAGVHARDELGRFFTIFESPVLSDETTGLSFSPDGKHMYCAFQVNGVLYDITRSDGLSFNAKSLDVKYHSVSNRRLNSQWIGL
jgi:hypothetical protein